MGTLEKYLFSMQVGSPFKLVIVLWDDNLVWNSCHLNIILGCAGIFVALSHVADAIEAAKHAVTKANGQAHYNYPPSNDCNLELCSMATLKTCQGILLPFIGWRD
jgi:hypothetical protein